MTPEAAPAPTEAASPLGSGRRAGGEGNASTAIDARPSTPDSPSVPPPSSPPPEAPKDIPHPSPQVLAVLCTASFLSALNFFATSPFYPEIADDLDTSVPLLGQATTLMILVSVACGIVIGPLADRIGFRRPLVVGVLCVAVNLIGTGLAPVYPVLLVLSLAGGLADAVVFGLPLAVAGTLYAGDAQRRAMTWIIGSMSVAPTIGVPGMTALGDLAGWRSALLITGGLTLVAAWATAVSMPHDARRTAERLRLGEVVAAYGPLLRHRPIVRLYVATALRGVTWFGMLTYLGAFLKEEIGLTTSQAGLVYAGTGAGYFLGGVVSGHLGAISPRTLLVVSYLAAGVAVGVTLLAANVWVAVALLVVTSVASFTAGLAQATLLTRDTPAGTGTTMVLNGSAMNLGAAIGAAVGGALLALGSYPALGWGLPIFAFAAAALVWWPLPKERPYGT